MEYFNYKFTHENESFCTTLAAVKINIATHNLIRFSTSSLSTCAPTSLALAMALNIFKSNFFSYLHKKSKRLVWHHIAINYRAPGLEH